jgi:hypothetical protein
MAEAETYPHVAVLACIEIGNLRIEDFRKYTTMAGKIYSSASALQWNAVQGFC